MVLSIIAGIREVVVCRRDRPGHGHIRKTGLKHVSTHIQKAHVLFAGIREVLLSVGCLIHHTENQKPKTSVVAFALLHQNVLMFGVFFSYMELHHVRCYTVT